MTKSEIIDYLNTCIKAAEQGQNIIADLIVIKKDLENKTCIF